MLGLFAFVSPWLLVGLAALPVLWFLLRVTPPSPRRVAFPPLRLLHGLNPRDETPARTPLWLLIMRMVLLALIVLALAHPLLNPASGLTRGGAIVIAVDDGWSGARHWNERRAMLDRLLDDAARGGRQVILFGTAPPAGLTAAPALSILRAADARAAAAKLTPLPWPEDRVGALTRLDRLGLDRAAATIWLSDGIEDGTARTFARSLERLGPLRVIADPVIERAHLLGPAPDQGKDLTVEVRRPAALGPDRVVVRAIGDDGRLLARARAAFKPGIDHVTAAFTNLPTELRNGAVSVVIEGERSAGATLLLDERWRRRPVGIAANEAGAGAQPLLSGAYYLQRALSPFAEVRNGAVGTLLKSGIAVLALPDNAVLGREQERLLLRWMNEGGLVLRFAGPHLAENPGEALLPVTLRGGRMLGSTLSWEKPAPLAPFAASSPFAGLAIPGDVTVSRQVLAEPTVDLTAKIWARLADGTPLVTADRRGKGWLVLVHTTADPEWSNLAISGLFVEMLRRIVAMSEGVAGNVDVALPPVETLDGFGRLGPAAATAQNIAAGAFAATLASPAHPPGFYGGAESRRALSLAPAVTRFGAIGALPGNIATESYQLGREVDFRPWLLAAALLLALIDLAVGYGLRGLLPRLGTASVVLLAALALAGPARAQNDEAAMVQAANQFHLAYVRTGIPEIDDESRNGLAGLANALNRRTAVEAAEPAAVDPESDELVFYPILYWPVVAGEMLPSARAVERLNRYLATGGMIVFDTRNQGEGTPLSDLQAQENLRRLAAGLQIPPLVPVPPDHVLTKSFYLMQEFPGRWVDGRVWVEAADDRVNDGVSSVVVGSNDWAGAWAVDANDLPMFPVVPGGERQREMAFRFGINLVMYALTGNYKSDQVHVPAILERLGQ
jgi:ABC-type amino acid transport substrate-binding protein